MKHRAASVPEVITGKDAPRRPSFLILSYSPFSVFCALYSAREQEYPGEPREGNLNGGGW
jgi:hypothetical protein